MEVQVSIEAERGCGFRKPGLYLMGPIPSEPCERLPFPFYGGWPKFMRGWLSINPSWLFEEHLHPECNLAIMGHNHDYCPVCNPPSLSYPAHYILWVGKQFYTPESFLKEASEVGISKRIGSVPDDFMFGESWVFLAHIEGANGVPGCIAAFKPTHVDLVVEDEEWIPEGTDELSDRLSGNLRVVKVIPDENDAEDS